MVLILFMDYEEFNEVFLFFRIDEVLRLYIRFYIFYFCGRFLSNVRCVKEKDYFFISYYIIFFILI